MLRRLMAVVIVAGVVVGGAATIAVTGAAPSKASCARSSCG